YKRPGGAPAVGGRGGAPRGAGGRQGGRHGGPPPRRKGDAGVGGGAEERSGRGGEPMSTAGAGMLRALAVDDEPPALDELAYLLRAADQVASVTTAGDATQALRALRDAEVDVVFLDIRMPGL